MVRGAVMLLPSALLSPRPICKVPPLIVVPPEYPFEPVSSIRPLPVLVSMLTPELLTGVALYSQLTMFELMIRSGPVEAIPP